MNKWVRAMVERARLGNGEPPQLPRHEPTLEELEQALRIDTFDLMNADAEQPELFYRVAKLLAGLQCTARRAAAA